MAHIRPFKQSDTEQMAHICRSTLPPTLAASEPAWRIAPYIWTLQYTTLSPDNCFVLDDGTGTAVGYVIGCPDVFAFAEAYPRYVETVLRGAAGQRDVPVPAQLVTPEPWFVPGSEAVPSQQAPGKPLGAVNEQALAQLAYNVRWLLTEGSARELVRVYRATMHIDLLAPFQGRGWGRRLIEAFVGSVREAVARGEGGLDAGRGINIGVAGENGKVVAFYERVGFRVYEGGEKEGSIWMVKDL